MPEKDNDKESKVAVNVAIDADELAALKAATMCNGNAPSVLIAVRKYIKDAAAKDAK